MAAGMNTYREFRLPRLHTLQYFNEQYEYLLQGSLPEANKDNLLHRLNGLCDMNGQGPERFHDHEMVLQLRPTGHGTPPNVQQAQQQAQQQTGPPQPMTLRVRRALELEHKEEPWHLRYVGQLDVGDKSRHTHVRNCIDVGTTENVVQFLQDMGYRLDFEFVVKGFIFRKGRMKVTLSEIYRMLQPGNVDQVERLTGSCLVELIVVAPQGQDQIQEDMKNFAEQLKPLVQLEKIDHRRLQQQQLAAASGGAAMNA